MAKVLRPSIQKQTRPQSLEKLPMAGISAPSDSRTGRIVKCTVRVLLENEGYRNDHGLSLINPVGQPKEEELLLADRVVDLILRLVNDPRQSGKRITVAQLEESDWHIEADNIHTEFNIVANRIFSEDINWGRIVSFLSFSSTFVLYAMRRGMSDSIIQSVCGWTVIFMESRLRDWFQAHSWEEFVAYAERILTARKRNEEVEMPGWQKLATIGAIGLGAAVLFSLRNSFS